MTEDEIFNNYNNDEIRNFIRDLKAKYNPNKFSNNDQIQREHHRIASLICSKYPA